MSDAWTPEPWTIRRGLPGKPLALKIRSVVPNDDLYDIAELPFNARALPAETVGANAARIVACVNALAGMEPEAVADVVAVARRKLSAELEEGFYLTPSGMELQRTLARLDEVAAQVPGQEPSAATVGADEGAAL